MVKFSTSYLFKLIVSERASSLRNICCVKLRKKIKTRNSVHTKCKGHYHSKVCILSLPCFSVGFTWWPVYANKAVSRNGGECLWMGLCGALWKTSAILTWSCILPYLSLLECCEIFWQMIVKVHLQGPTGTLKLDVRFEGMWRLTKDYEQCHEEGEVTLLFSKFILFQRNVATGLHSKEVDVFYIQDGVCLHPILGRTSAHHARLLSYEE